MLITPVYFVLITFIIFAATQAAPPPHPPSTPSTPSTTSSSTDGNSNFKVVYESPNAFCYAENKAYLCAPPFTNIAEGVPVRATSTCGQSGAPEKICKSWNDGSGIKRGKFCEICDDRKPQTNRGPKRLTDRHIASNQTCWVSGRVEPATAVNLTLSLGKRFEIFYVSLQPCGPLPDSIALYKSSDFGRTWKPWQYFSTDCYRAFGLPTSIEHSAQISSANIQEVLCVALKPPSPLNTQGQSQGVIAFSTTIGRSTSHPWSPALIDWMTMTDLQVSLMRFPESPKKGRRSTVLSRRDRSGGIRRWATKPPVFRLGSSMHHENKMQADGGRLRNTTEADERGDERGGAEERGDADDGDEETGDKAAVHFAFSDIAVGGRCKCNGHANRCVRDRILEKNAASGEETVAWGPLRCDCQHNTVGSDCERCALGYLDRPWARAINEDANVCKVCQCNNHTTSCLFDINRYRRSGGRSGGVCLSCQHNTDGVNCAECIAGFTRKSGVPLSSTEACQACECNLHSKSCVFSQQLYLLSKKVSGGSCEDCRHHTTGEKCHQCKDGFYRDWTKPISHPRVCLECQCHPIGSIGTKPCDRKTGQCQCKTGVTGQTCNRCLDGYKQTRSKITPCVKVVNALMFVGSATRSSPQVAVARPPANGGQCKPCDQRNKRFKFKKFCRRQAVFRGTVVSQETRGDLTRLVVQIQDVWRSVGPLAQRQLPGHVRRFQAPSVAIWVPLTKQTGRSGTPLGLCVCPRFDVGQTYLFISQTFEIPYNEKRELLLDQKTTVLQWDESWRRRLMRFAERQDHGKCESLADNAFSKVPMSKGRRNVHLPPQPTPLNTNQMHYQQSPSSSSSYGASIPQASYYRRQQPLPSQPMPPGYGVQSAYANHQYRAMRHLDQTNYPMNTQHLPLPPPPPPNGYYSTKEI